MQSLKSIVAALRQEIEAALESPENPGRAVRLDPERVELSLQVQLEFPEAQPGTLAGPPRMRFHPNAPSADGSQASTGHTLKIEFKLSRTDSPSAAAPLSAPRPARSGLLNDLSDLFGPPGFDSSARAMVFCETLEGLSDPDFGVVRRVLAGEPVPDQNETVRRAKHLLMGLIRSGPLKDVGRGSALLAALFAEQSRETLVGLVRQRWKTQQDWMNG